MGSAVVRLAYRRRRDAGKSRPTLEPDTKPVSAPLSIVPVETANDRETFLRVPWAIYRDDPHWIPPLLVERRDHLNPKKNPFFHNADATFWLARRGDETVGRISAQVNRAYLKQHDDATGHFGFLEAEDNAETFEALLSVAEQWLRDHGMQRVTGPFSLSINDEAGLLVDGFNDPPFLMMGHARPYYCERLENAGYTKAKDLICYSFSQTQDKVGKIDGFLARAKQIDGLVIRPLDMGRYEAEIDNIIDIFNDAWSENWGFVPMVEAEVRHMAKMLRPLVRPDNFAIAELEGRPVAMAVSLPNVNEAIADLDGRLLPFGWAKLLWRIKTRKTKSARMPLMGVRKEYQGALTGAILAFSVIDAVRTAQFKAGVEKGELSWILEDNLPVRNMIELCGGVPYKTYRIYERGLL